MAVNFLLMKKCVTPKLLLVLWLFVVSCKGETDSFYSHYKEDDLYRLPLIPPYQLQSLAGFDDSQSEAPTWELYFIHGGDKESYGFSTKTLKAMEPRAWATEVNVSNQVIYGHSEIGAFGKKKLWFVVVPKEKIEKVFGDDELGWRAYLKQKGIETVILFSVWSIFEQFKKSYVLPWYNPQKNIYPNHNQ